MNNNSTTKKITIQELQHKLLKRAKVNPDTEALNMSDPTNQGTPSQPGATPGVRTGLPANATNANKSSLDSRLLSTTNPSAVGTGNYVTPENGTARDNAVRSPGAPLSKIATDLIDGVNSLTNPYESGRINQDVLEKLAGVTSTLLQYEDGRQVVNQILNRDLGIKEAHDMHQQALATVQELQQQKAASQIIEMRKEASHSPAVKQLANNDEALTWYVQGALRSEEIIKQAAAGVPVEEEPADASDEDVLGILSSMIESGEITEQDAQALIQQVQGDEQPQYTPEQLLELVGQAAQTGELPEEQAVEIAQALLMKMGIDPSAIGGEQQAPMPEETKMASYRGLSNAQAALINAFR
ncbi:MAG: hypothetical protein RR382_00980 [Tannerellaceae bacterium]